MKGFIFRQLLVTILLSLIGVFAINVYLPPSSEGALLGWVFELLLIAVGVMTAVLMGDVFPRYTPLGFVVFIGALSVIMFVFSYRAKSLALNLWSIFLWVMVGFWSTFWGLAYSI